MEAVTEIRACDVLVVAAEASSELYAYRIMQEVERRSLPLKFFGIGSPRMRDLGLDLVEDSSKMAVVGIWEVLSNLKVIAAAFKSLVRLAKKKKPKVALLLDYPEFNLKLAKKLRRQGIPVVYYISPQIWAWRTYRVHSIKKRISRMLVVFPFEKIFYQSYNVPSLFVGHPLLDEIGGSKLTAQQRTTFREEVGAGEKNFLIALLPGSRNSEIKYCLEIQLKTAEKLSAERPHCRFLLLVAPTLEISHLENFIPDNLKQSIRLVKDEPLKVLQACDAALVASGTATLVTGLAECPMVIMYKVNALTGFLARRLVTNVSMFGMVNLIMGEQIVPELFQEAASVENLSGELKKYIDQKDYYREVKNKLALVKQRLGNGGASERVVDALIDVVKEAR